MRAGEAAGDITVEVVHASAAHRVWQCRVEIAAGATVRDALRASGALVALGLDERDVDTGVWGKPRPLEHRLRANDRVELYRGLKVDPKEARRQRYRKHREGRMGG